MVGTQDTKVGWRSIFPVSVDMVDRDGRPSGDGIEFAPTARFTPSASRFEQVSSDVAGKRPGRRTVAGLCSCQPPLDVATIGVITLALGVAVFALWVTEFRVTGGACFEITVAPLPLFRAIDMPLRAPLRTLSVLPPLVGNERNATGGTELRCCIIVGNALLLCLGRPGGRYQSAQPACFRFIHSRTSDIL